MTTKKIFGVIFLILGAFLVLPILWQFKVFFGMIAHGAGDSVEQAFLLGYGLAIVVFLIPAVLFIVFGIRWVKDKGPQHR